MLPRKERIEARAVRKAEQLDKTGKKKTFDKKAFVAASDASTAGFGGNPAAWDASGKGDEAQGNGSAAGGKPK